MDEVMLLISLKVPRDVIDVELFVKMTKGHFGILMDPWSSSSWREVLEPVTHPQQDYKREDPVP